MLKPEHLLGIGVVFALGLAVGMLAPKKDKTAVPPAPAPGPTPGPVLQGGNSKTYIDENAIEWTFYAGADGHWEATTTDVNVEPIYAKTFYGNEPDEVLAQIQEYAASVDRYGAPKTATPPPIVPPTAVLLGTSSVTDKNGLPWNIEQFAAAVGEPGAFVGSYTGPPGVDENGVTPSPYGAVYGVATPVFLETSAGRVQEKINTWSAQYPLAAV